MELGDWQFVPLADRSKAMIRAIGAGDGPMLQAFVRGLSVRSRYFRFFSAIRELSAAHLERLVNVDHRRGFALVALHGRSCNTAIIAEARCVLDREENSAEFAIVVADEFQRQGLGTRLMKKLLAHASEKRIHRLFGEILVDNRPMLALAERLGFHIRVNALDHSTMIASITSSGRRTIAEPWTMAGKVC